MTVRPSPKLDTRTDGEAWAAEVRRQTIADKRRVAGGWPGTMSEARARVARLAAQQRQIDASVAEREQAARALYDSARAWWLLHQEKGRDEDDL